MRAKIIWAVTGVVLLIVLGWLFNHSRLEVVVGESNSGTKVTIVNQSNGKEDTIETKDSSVKKVITRGGSSILVKQGDKSYFTQIKAFGFFTKTTVKATFEPEKARSFVGNNPAPCKFYSNNVLSTYECDTSTKAVSIHTPATATQPTTTLFDKNTNLSGTLEGTVQTSEGTIALVRIPASQGVVEHRELFLVTSAAAGNSYTPLKQEQITGSAPFSIAPYKAGFVVFSPTLGKIQTYDTVSSKPKSVTVKKPGKKGMDLSYVTGDQQRFAAVYTNEPAQASEDKKTEGKTAVVVYGGDEVKEYGFNTSFTMVRLCGDKQLCAINPQTSSAEIYNINGSKAKLISRIPGVTILGNTQSGTVFIRGNSVIGYNPKSNTGAIEYNLGNYGYCGIQELSTSYVVCLTDARKDKVALLIDQTSSSSDNIDKKILELQKLPEIKRLSVYKNYLFVTPNLGEPVYINSLKLFGYNPTTKKVVNDKINKTAIELGIDPKTYTIINTAGQ